MRTSTLSSYVFDVPLATDAHPCYPHPREGPTPHPGSHSRFSRKGPGRQRRHVRPCPTLSRSVTLLRTTGALPLQILRTTTDSPSYEHNRMSQNRTDFALPPSREWRLWPWPVVWNRLSGAIDHKCKQCYVHPRRPVLTTSENVRSQLSICLSISARTMKEKAPLYRAYFG